MTILNSFCGQHMNDKGDDVKEVCLLQKLCVFQAFEDKCRA